MGCLRSIFAQGIWRFNCLSPIPSLRDRSGKEQSGPSAVDGWTSRTVLGKRSQGFVFIECPVNTWKGFLDALAPGTIRLRVLAPYTLLSRFHTESQICSQILPNLVLLEKTPKVAVSSGNFLWPCWALQ